MFYTGLIEELDKVRILPTKKDLFDEMDFISKKFEKREIPRNEYDEIKDLIMARIKEPELANL